MKIEGAFYQIVRTVIPLGTGTKDRREGNPPLIHGSVNDDSRIPRSRDRGAVNRRRG